MLLNILKWFSLKWLWIDFYSIQTAVNSSEIDWIFFTFYKRSPLPLLRVHWCDTWLQVANASTNCIDSSSFNWKTKQKLIEMVWVYLCVLRHIFCEIILANEIELSCERCAIILRHVSVLQSSPVHSKHTYFVLYEHIGAAQFGLLKRRRIWFHLSLLL